jgi:hypothetical protein
MSGDRPPSPTPPARHCDDRDCVEHYIHCTSLKEWSRGENCNCQPSECCCPCPGCRAAGEEEAKK